MVEIGALECAVGTERRLRQSNDFYCENSNDTCGVKEVNPASDVMVSVEIRVSKVKLSREVRVELTLPSMS